MITASEPQEFIPRGRHPMRNHPGPLKKDKPKPTLSEEMLLLRRFENVSLTSRIEPSEFYSLRETLIKDATDEDNLMPYAYCEEELYVHGHTAFWTNSMGNAPTVRAYKSFSIERPIKHAFFSPRRFLEPDTALPGKPLNRDGICVVDDEVLHVYCSNGDMYATKLECPISAVWPTPFGLMFEKEPANSLVTKLPTEPMPRVFTLGYPSEEMKPVLFIGSDISFSYDYMNKPEHRVVFVCEQVELVLVYDKRERKHFICWMRLASEEEKAAVQTTDGSEASCVQDSEEYDISFGNACATGTYAPTTKRQSVPATSTSMWLPDLTDQMTPSPFDQFLSELPGDNLDRESTSKQAAPAANVRITTAAAKFLENIGPLELLIEPDPEPIDMRRIGFADGWLPIVPQYSLQRIWQDSSHGKIASIGFLHSDLVGSRYICYLQPGSNRLSLVQYELGTEAPKIVAYNTIAACTAVPLERLNLIILLDPAGKLTLYSGPQIVGKVHVSGLLLTSLLSSSNASQDRVTTSWKRSSLLPNIAPSCDSKFEEELHQLSPVRGGSTNEGDCLARPDVHLCDGTGTRFTIAFGGGVTDDSGNGRSFRVTLPPLAESQLLRRCLVALRHVLPTKTAHDFLIRWYGTRNVPGTHAGISIRREWGMFQTCLLTALGRPVVWTDSPTENSKGCPSASRQATSVSFLKKRRKRENTQGTEDDWQYLLQKMASEPFPVGPTADCSSSAKWSPARAYKQAGSFSLFPHIPEVLEVLHLLYEDFKLDTGLTDELQLLGEFLFVLVSDAQIYDYEQHYFVDCPELGERYQASAFRIADNQLTERMERNALRLPHIFQYLKALILGRPDQSGLQTANDTTELFVPYPHIKGVNDRSRDVVVLVALMFRERRLTKWVQAQLDSLLSPERLNAQLSQKLLNLSSVPGSNECESDLFGNTVLRFLIDRGYTRERLDDLPVAVRFLVSQTLEQLREFVKHGHDAEVYQLLLRPDLFQHSISAGPASNSKSVSRKHKRRVKDEPRIEADCSQWLTDMAEFDALMGIVSTKEDPQRLEREDGMDMLDLELLKLRFPYDRRIDDVRKFLTSSRRVLIDIPQLPSVSDHDFIEEQERRLYSLCLRTMAQPVGRGMFTFATSYPGQGEIMRMPRLCLTGREPLRGATIELVQLEVPPHMNLWPLFHNGVAAGLRICPDATHVTSSWIVSNAASASRRANASTNSCPYSPGNESLAEHGGFLLALGLTGHLRKLSMYSVFDYMVRSHELLRIGMVLGLSIAYRGTAHMRTTCLLAVHLEALLPPTAIELDVTQALQVAALFGMGLVYQGTAKRHVAQVLLQEIGRPPGPEMENAVERESYALAAGLALGMVTLGRGDQLNELRDLAIPGELYHYMTGGSRRAPECAQREKYKLPSFQIREGDDVNLDVTAPGATLALGLMFFGTNDPTISGWMEPPATKYQFGYVRPDMLLLRIIARHLICWDQVQHTREWVDAQVPGVLHDAIAFVENRTERFSKLTMALQRNLPRVERELYCQAHCVIVCGSAVGIGLRFAGTGDPMAADTVHHYLRYFIALRHMKTPPEPEGQPVDPAEAGKRLLAKLVGCQVLENCVLMTLLALSLVLAGTGDVRVLRTVRMMRSRIGVPGCTYGSHMATHMALGFVFLGSGRYTLSRSPPAIAAIVCAIFPKFPSYSNDNRYHLQALRHLYVLALEPRLFVPRRVDSGQLTMCLIHYATRDNPQSCTIKRMSPCMLPELHTLAWVEVHDENFYTVRFDASNWHLLENILHKRGYFDVVQHIGCLSFMEDPTRTITMHMRNLPGKHNNSWKVRAEYLLELVSQPFITYLTENLLMEPEFYLHRAGIEPTKNLPSADQAVYYFQVLVAHCVVYDRFHALSMMLEVAHLILHPRLYREHRATDTWQLLLLKTTLSRRMPILSESGEQFPGQLWRSLVLRAHGGWARDWRRYRLVLQTLCGTCIPAETPLFERLFSLTMAIGMDVANYDDDDDDDDDDDEGGAFGSWLKISRRTSILTNVARIIAQHELPLREINRKTLASLWPCKNVSMGELVYTLGLHFPQLPPSIISCLANILNRPV